MADQAYKVLEALREGWDNESRRYALSELVRIWFEETYISSHKAKSIIDKYVTRLVKEEGGI